MEDIVDNTKNVPQFWISSPTFIEHLSWAKPCARYKGYKEKQDTTWALEEKVQIIITQTCSLQLQTGRRLDRNTKR